MATVDYLGFRLTAMSLVPISKRFVPREDFDLEIYSTIVYGSSDAGDTMHADPMAVDCMEGVCKKLNLKKHRCGMKCNFFGTALNKQRGKYEHLFGPTDIELHKGSDGAFYVHWLLMLHSYLPGY